VSKLVLGSTELGQFKLAHYPAVNVMGHKVTSSHNNGFGVRAVGATAGIALSRSTVTDNVRGIGASSGGVLVPYSRGPPDEKAAGMSRPALSVSSSWTQRRRHARRAGSWRPISA
jgi:hypothetical protein